jgi:hypothetical protein
MELLINSPTSFPETSRLVLYDHRAGFIKAIGLVNPELCLGKDDPLQETIIILYCAEVIPLPSGCTVDLTS